MTPESSNTYIHENIACGELDKFTYSTTIENMQYN